MNVCPERAHAGDSQARLQHRCYLRGDDVADGGEEVLQARVAGRHEDPLCHLGELAGAGQLGAGLGVTPDDLLGGVGLWRGHLSVNK
jgi:hypothetical protein